MLNLIKNYKKWFIGGFGFIIVSTVGIFIYDVVTDITDEYQRRGQEIERLRSNIDTFEEDIGRLRRSNESLERSLNEARRHRDRIQEQLERERQIIRESRERLNEQEEIIRDDEENDRVERLLNDPRARELVLSRINDFIKCWTENFNRVEGECVRGEWVDDDTSNENNTSNENENNTSNENENNDES